MSKGTRLIFLLLLSINTVLAAPPSIMPEGLENVYMDMPIKELLATRTNIKSGTTYDYCFSHGSLFCKWYKDPNNPNKLDQSFNTHLFKENFAFLFFDAVWFSCGSDKLYALTVDGAITTRKKREEFSKKRDEFVLYAVKKWGKPEQLLVGDEKFTRAGRHDYYSITMNWLKGGTIIHAEFPLAIEEYFKSLSVSEKLGNKLSNIMVPYPQVKIMIIPIPFAGSTVPIYMASSGQLMTRREANLLSIPINFKPRQIVNREEAEKLLKLINFDGLIERALTK